MTYWSMTIETKGYVHCEGWVWFNNSGYQQNGSWEVFFFFLGKKLGSILVAEKAYLLVGNDSSGNIVVGIFLVS